MRVVRASAGVGDGVRVVCVLVDENMREYQACHYCNRHKYIAHGSTEEASD